jgi:hypothetical protein
MALTLILQVLAFLLISLAWALRRKPLPRIIAVFSVGQACAIWSAYRLLKGNGAELPLDGSVALPVIWLVAGLLALCGAIFWAVWSASSLNRYTPSDRSDEVHKSMQRGAFYD